MSIIEELLESLKNFGERSVYIDEHSNRTYSELLSQIDTFQSEMLKNGIDEHDVVIVRGDFDFTALAVLMALALRKAIILPQTEKSYEKLESFIQKTEPDFFIDLIGGKAVTTKLRPRLNSLLKSIVPAHEPGLVVFTSGSTGTPKGIIHNFSFLCSKFKGRSASSHRAIPFLLFDHLGGVNTALSLMFSGGCIVQIKDRTPENICRSIENFKVSLLPTTPTFLNMLLVSGLWKKYDLSSLKLVTYGTEVMSETILKKLVDCFPQVKFKQTYGLSEMGVMASTSRSNDTTWVKVGGEEFQTKVIDQILWIKGKSKMLGHLSFETKTPQFIEAKDEWFCTNDIVEQDGEWLRFKGRNTDIINVSGLKVYPSEIESCLLECDFVGAATVGSKKNALIGNMIVAHIELKNPIDRAEAKKRLEEHCKSKLERFKVPQQFVFMDHLPVSDRFKKSSIRNA